MIVSEHIDNALRCYHCGDNCDNDIIYLEDKVFCCTGCKTVYEILNENQLCNYYVLNDSPGKTRKKSAETLYDYLDDKSIRQKLIDFEDESITTVTFSIPQMHCSACIWLLENLYKINSAITASRVNFLKKQLSIRFITSQLTLKEIVILLDSIGYEPLIRLDAVDEKKKDSNNNKLYLKLGVAAFCFGNIMLLSFPEYLSINTKDTFYIRLFAYLNLLLSLPVFFYSSLEYFISAYRGLKSGIINLDVPLSIGIVVLFGRTAFEILTHTGAGYADSLAGLLFFLLLGKLFQAKTYDSLNFDRSYKSYFPLAVITKKNNKEVSVPVAKLKQGDRIIIRNSEIIPADSILFNGEGQIDYSFVTGESKPVAKVSGELIYAGGRQIGGAIELEVVKEVSQSYLTQLWNNDLYNKSSKHIEKNYTQFSNTVSKYFTIVILLVAVVSSLLWLPNVHIAMDVFTAVLIIACPCAIALSTPFTLGHTLRIFGRNKFYVKNTHALEELAKIETVVFDKTGTITETTSAAAEYTGRQLTDYEKLLVKAAARNSTHPLSKSIYDSIIGEGLPVPVVYNEYEGRGIEAVIEGKLIRLGSASFTQTDGSNVENTSSTRVYLNIDDEAPGYFSFPNCYRAGIDKVIDELGRKYELALLSGDNEGEKENLLRFFKYSDKLHFRQSPQDKLHFINSLQDRGKRVLMVGDGLNDAGALNSSNVGIAVTEDISSFSPACDAIMEASVFNRLSDFIRFAASSVKIIRWSFIISSGYNIIGLSFAVQGMLSPIVAAVLMPLSSISMVLYTTLLTNLIAKRRKL